MACTLKLLVTAVTAASLLTIQASSQTVSVRDLADYGVTLIGPGSPEFASSLSRTATAEKRSILEPLLPFSVVLVNKSNQTILAHTLRWVCTAPDGRRTYGTYTGAADVMTFTKGPRVPPGSATLVTPISSGDVRAHPARAQAVQNAERRLRSQKEIVIVLDGVLFEDGRFAGPNETKIRDHHEGQVAASQEIQSTVLTKEKQGEHADAIFAWLKSVGDSNTPMPGGNGTAIAWYQHWRSTLAQIVLRMRASSGDAAALGAVRGMKVVQISTASLAQPKG